jgi:hypothetical protein
MRRRFALLTIGVALSLSGRLAADPPTLISGFDEELHPSLKVSGFHVEGFMRQTKDFSPNPDLISVWLSGGQDRLCVSATTVDGYYEATAKFDIRTTEAGIFELDFVSEADFKEKKKDVFASYGPQELILRGRVGLDCSDLDSLFEVPMIWGCAGPKCDEPVLLSDEHSDDSGYHYQLFINSDGLQAEIVIPWLGQPNKTARFPCTDIPTAREPRSYDKACSIIFHDQLDAGRARINFEYYGETLQPKPLSLMFLRNEQ